MRERVRVRVRESERGERVRVSKRERAHTHTLILHCLSIPLYSPTIPLARAYPNLSPATGHSDTTESASENSENK